MTVCFEVLRVKLKFDIRNGCDFRGAIQFPVELLRDRYGRLLGNGLGLSKHLRGRVEPIRASKRSMSGLFLHFCAYLCHYE